MNVTIASHITPFLWFDQNAEEAADFYVSVFPNSRRLGALQSDLDSPYLPKGKPVTVSFELDGLRFTALNGGPAHANQFNNSISFVVSCETQAEIDDYWAKLTAGGGEEIACGWLKDKFGLAWQIVPSRIGELLSRPKAMQAMMNMKKLDIATLEAAGRE